MSSDHLAVERQRERAVRMIRCPVCDAPSRKPCRYPKRVARKDGKPGGTTQSHAHVGRYDLAASKGLVPHV
jgi:hypothetical protein